MGKHLTSKGHLAALDKSGLRVGTSGEIQEPVSNYLEVGLFTPRPFLKTEQIMVDPPQIKTEPEEVFPEVGIDPGCIKIEKGEVDCKKEPGQVMKETVSPVSDNSKTSTLPLSTISQEGKLFSKLMLDCNQYSIRTFHVNFL